MKKILAIDPGTRYIGIAYFDDKKLTYYGVKTIEKKEFPRDTLKESRTLLLRLISDFDPDTLVVEKTFFSNNKNSALLNVLADEMLKIGKSKGLKVISFAANTVRKLICGNGAATKDDVAKVIITLYPELKPYLHSDKKWKELFYRNIFDAIALGLSIYRSIKQK